MTAEIEPDPPATHHLTYLAGRLLPAIIGFSALIGYSHIVGAAVYGEFAVAMGFANILLGALFIWIRMTLTRFGATGDARAERLIGVGLAVYGAFAVTVFAIVGAIAILVQSPTALLVALLTFAIGWSDLNLDLLRAQHRPGRYGVQYLARQSLTVLFVLLAIVLGSPINPIVLGYVLGNVVSSLMLIREILPRSAYRFTRVDLQEFFAHGAPLSINYLISSLTYTLDRLIISWLLGKEAAGVYSLAADLVIQILGVVMDGITLAFLPQAARALDRRGSVAASNVLLQNLLVLLGLSLPAALGLAVCGPYVAMLFLGPEFAVGASFVIPILSIAILFRGLRVYFIDNVLQINNRASLAAVGTGISAAGLGALCLILVPIFGISGAGVASLISTAAAALFGLAVSRHHLAQAYPSMDIGKLLLASIASAASAGAVLARLPNLVGLGSAVMTGVVVYALGVQVLNPGGLRERTRAFLGGRSVPRR